MGYGRWRDDDYLDYAARVATLSREEVYTSRGLMDNLDPRQFDFRESRDSEQNPLSTPLMFALDVTGSMGFIAERLAKDSLGQLVNQLLERKPVPDPHMLFMGIGDAVARDSAPLQATQFEPDNVLIDQLTRIWLEGGGGGNSFESYDLAWVFAAYKTCTDAWEKRQQKGYLFTIGDEEFPKASAPHFVEAIAGSQAARRITPKAALATAQQRYRVFHIVVLEGSYARMATRKVLKTWRKHLGRRVLPLTNHRHVAEVIASAIQVAEGGDVQETIASWNKDVRKTVRQALLGE